ncbi:MAG: MFS transporter, partial [Bacteroidota bacterium]
QISLGWTATETGVFMIPSALCSAVAMPTVAKLLAKGVNPKSIIIIGIMMTFTFLMMLSFSSPDSSEKDFYFPFILRGLGMGFMMSPIISLAVAGLRGKDLAQAVGLANMVRQLGGAVGIAFINVYLSHQNAVIKGNMLSYVTEFSNVSAERIAAFTQNFLSMGYAQGDAESLASKMMENIVFKQQAIASYDKGFFIVGLSILIGIPIVLMIRYKKAEKVKPVNDH